MRTSRPKWGSEDTRGFDVATEPSSSKVSHRRPCARHGYRDAAGRSASCRVTAEFPHEGRVRPKQLLPFFDQRGVGRVCAKCRVHLVDAGDQLVVERDALRQRLAKRALSLLHRALGAEEGARYWESVFDGSVNLDDRLGKAGLVGRPADVRELGSNHTIELSDDEGRLVPAMSRAPAARDAGDVTRSRRPLPRR
jgi:hypothetical protein